MLRGGLNIMKTASILLLLCSFLLAGCGGGNDPVNEGKDKPVQAKKEKTKEKEK
jgi:hypothetical protein